MNFLLDVKLLVLLGVANGTPVFAYYFLGQLWARPLDGGLKLPDGQPVFGESKTVRGILLSLIATMTFGFILGFAWQVAVLIAATAMIGDLASSFLKRRMGMPASSMAIGIDQIPESVLPLLACAKILALSLLDIAAVAICFFLGELWISRILYRLHLRSRPY